MQLKRRLLSRRPKTTRQRTARPNLLLQRAISAPTINLARAASPKTRLILVLEMKRKRRSILKPKLPPKPKLKQIWRTRLLQMPKQNRNLTPLLRLKPEPRKHPKLEPDRRKKSPLPAPNICAPELPRLPPLPRSCTHNRMPLPRTSPKQRLPTLLPSLNLPVLLRRMPPACDCSPLRNKNYKAVLLSCCRHWLLHYRARFRGRAVDWKILCIYCEDGRLKLTSTQSSSGEMATGWRTAPSAHHHLYLRLRHLPLLRHVRGRLGRWHRVAQDRRRSSPPLQHQMVS